MDHLFAAWVREQEQKLSALRWAVSNGRLTQQEADTHLRDLSESVAEVVTERGISAAERGLLVEADLLPPSPR